MSPPRGALDPLQAHQISGWAIGEGSRLAQVRIAINGEDVATVTANRMRRDIARQGLHITGLCGFVHELPPERPLTDADVVSVRIADRDIELEDSPRRLPPEAPAPPAVAATAGERAARPVRAQGKRGAGAAPVPAKQARPAPTAPPDSADESRSLMAEPEPRSGRAGPEGVPDFPPPPPSLGRSSGRIFTDALMAFFLRELRGKYSAFRLGYVWALVQPLAYILMFRFIRSMFGGVGSDERFDVSYFWYFTAGVVPFFMFQHGFHQCMGAIASFRGLFNYREVKPIDIIIVRVAIEFLTMIVVLAIMVWGFLWFDVAIDLDDLLSFTIVIFFLFLFSLGVGLLADVYVTRDRELRQVFTLIERPLFFISGLFFVITDLPEGPFKDLMLLNPLLHAVDLCRGALLHQYDSPASWTYLIISSLTVLMLGLAAYRRHLNALTE